MIRRAAAIATAFVLGGGAGVVAVALWSADWSHESTPLDGPGPLAAAKQQVAETFYWHWLADDPRRAERYRDIVKPS